VRADAPPGEDLDPPQPGTRRHALLGPGAIGLHVFALVVTVLCVLAGSWQLDAWRNEQALEGADRSGAAPVPVAELLDVDAGLRSDVVGRRVTAEGTYAPAEDQLLVAGREHEGRDGWWVLSPLVVAEDTALLVVRGWTAEEVLPPVPQGQVSVTVSVQPGEEAGPVPRCCPPVTCRSSTSYACPAWSTSFPTGCTRRTGCGPTSSRHPTTAWHR
jgi:hypothetical protein